MKSIVEQFWQQICLFGGEIWVENKKKCLATHKNKNMYKKYIF
jgi:hypothetical protein